MTSENPQMAFPSDALYRAQALAVLAAVERQLDAWLNDDVVDIDTMRTGGMLELSFPGGSKMVMNLQPPLQEIWLAAVAGGYHFRWAGDAWRDTRSAQTLGEVLSEQASRQAGVTLRFEL